MINGLHPKPDMISVGEEVEAMFWKQFQETGPRHRNVYRWMHLNGWGIARDACERYLEPEMLGRRH